MLTEIEHKGDDGYLHHYESDDIEFCLGQNTVFIIPKCNSKYLYYFLNSPFAKKQMDIGACIKGNEGAIGMVFPVGLEHSEHIKALWYQI